MAELMREKLTKTSCCPVCGRVLSRIARSVSTVRRRGGRTTFARIGWGCKFCKVIVQLFKLTDAWK